VDGKLIVLPAHAKAHEKKTSEPIADPGAAGGWPNLTAIDDRPRTTPSARRALQ
jgi:hypothetical protein